jgi:hypothetical protein
MPIDAARAFAPQCRLLHEASNWESSSHFWAVISTILIPLKYGQKTGILFKACADAACGMDVDLEMMMRECEPARPKPGPADITDCPL